MKYTPEELKARREARKNAREAAKTQERINKERNQKPIKSIVIIITWAKSRTWGNNPHAEAQISFKDGTYTHLDGITCSGYGYDKESTVIADIFNACLKYKLWGMTSEQIKGGHGSGDNGPAPYGICCYSENNRHFSGGIGTNCYYDISSYIGGKFEHTASGKTFDVYTYTDNV